MRLAGAPVDVQVLGQERARRSAARGCASSRGARAGACPRRRPGSRCAPRARRRTPSGSSAHSSASNRALWARRRVAGVVQQHVRVEVAPRELAHERRRALAALGPRALLDLARRDAAEVQVGRQLRRPAGEQVVALGVAIDPVGEPAAQPLARGGLAGRERLGGLGPRAVRDRTRRRARRAPRARAARRGPRAAAAAPSARQNGLKTRERATVRASAARRRRRRSCPDCRPHRRTAASTRRSRAIANGETSEAKWTASAPVSRASSGSTASGRPARTNSSPPRSRSDVAQLPQRARAGTTRGWRTGSARRPAAAGRARTRARCARPRAAPRSARGGRARAGRAGTRRSRFASSPVRRARARGSPGASGGTLCRWRSCATSRSSRSASWPCRAS